MIPFLDLAALNRRHQKHLHAACARVIDSGQYILGGEVAAFEQSFAAYCARRHCIGVASGLDALILILRAAVNCGKIPAAAEVIVPANTYIASILAIVHAGLLPRLAEPEDLSFNLRAQTADARGTAKTGALMTTHLYGQATDMAELQDLCRARGWFLLSDAAQAHGAQNGGKPAAAFGDAAGFSFYPGKNLGALGDGGAAVTDDDELAAQIRLLRNYGAAQKYHNTALGVNSRLDDMQAALLSAKLPFLDTDNARRRTIASRYQQDIRHHQILLPLLPPEINAHVWHLFVIRCQHRDALQRHLHESGIGTLIHYPLPPHRQPIFAAAAFVEDFPLTDQLANEVLSLPLNPTLSDDAIAQIIAAVNRF